MNIKPDQNLAKDTKQKTGVSFAASLEFRNIHHEYNGKETLQGINLTVEPGEVLCLLGPSGSGKSTFLNIAGLLENFTHGEYILDGDYETRAEVANGRRNEDQDQLNGHADAGVGVSFKLNEKISLFG